MGAHSEPQSWYNYFKLKTFEIQPMQKKRKKAFLELPLSDQTQQILGVLCNSLGEFYGF